MTNVVGQHPQSHGAIFAKEWPQVSKKPSSHIFGDYHCCSSRKHVKTSRHVAVVAAVWHKCPEGLVLSFTGSVLDNECLGQTPHVIKSFARPFMRSFSYAIKAHVDVIWRCNGRSMVSDRNVSIRVWSRRGGEGGGAVGRRRRRRKVAEKEN